MNFLKANCMLKHYNNWIGDIINLLKRDDIVYETTEEHRRGDVYPDESNYIVVRDTSRRKDPNILLKLLERLYDEHDKVSGMITDVCEKWEMHLQYDVEIYMNYQKVFAILAELRNMEEKVTYETQKGYKVNSEGRQVPYKCHIRKTYIPDFNQNKIAEMYEDMFRKFMEKRYVDEMGEEEIPFESIFYRLDSLEEVYNIFRAQLQDE